MPSLVLFVDSFPTSFSVQKKKDCYVLRPKENPYDSLPPPIIEVFKNNGSWIVKGTDDQNLIDQIIEDFNAGIDFSG